MIKKIIFSVVLLLWLAACSPQERIARIAKKYNLYQIDTLHFIDTVYLPARTIITQTALTPNGKFDFENEKIAYSGTINDSIVYLTVVVPADTIYIEKTIPTTKIEIKEKTKTEFPVVSLLFCFAVGCMVTNYIIKRFKKG
jgi:hypothetical protein